MNERTTLNCQAMKRQKYQEFSLVCHLGKALQMRMRAYFTWLVHMYDASISTSTSTSTRKKYILVYTRKASASNVHSVKQSASDIMHACAFEVLFQDGGRTFDIFLLLLLLGLRRRRRQRQIQKRKRCPKRVRVRDIFQRRHLQGDYHNIPFLSLTVLDTSSLANSFFILSLNTEQLLSHTTGYFVTSSANFSWVVIVEAANLALI